MLDSRVPCLRRHRSLQATHLEPRALQPIRNEIEEVNKLAEDETLGRRVLQPEIAQLLDERLDLGRRPPRVQVQPPEYALPCGRQILLEFERRRVQVDRQRQMAHRAAGLQVMVSMRTEKRSPGPPDAR